MTPTTTVEDKLKTALSSLQFLRGHISLARPCTIPSEKLSAHLAVVQFVPMDLNILRPRASEGPHPMVWRINEAAGDLYGKLGKPKVNELRDFSRLRASSALWMAMIASQAALSSSDPEGQLNRAYGTSVARVVPHKQHLTSSQEWALQRFLKEILIEIIPQKERVCIIARHRAEGFWQLCHDGVSTDLCAKAAAISALCYPKDSSTKNHLLPFMEDAAKGRDLIPKEQLAALRLLHGELFGGRQKRIGLMLSGDSNMAK